MTENHQISFGYSINGKSVSIKVDIDCLLIKKLKNVQKVWGSIKN